MLPLLSTALLTLTLVDALNVPSNNPDGSTTVHLSRRKYTHPHKLAPEDFKNYAYTMRKKMAQKYSPNSSDKRASTGDIPLVNQNADVSYFATLQAGTPAVQYSIVLDTGSSDLWLASSQCLQGCNAITNRYDASKSSSAKGSNQPFSIKYGSGAVAGNVVQDTVSMAGFTIPNQIFGAVTQLSTGVISGSLSGLMGLAFSPLSQTGSTPFTQALAQGNQLTNPLMAFYLTRFIDDPSAQAEEYGGQFTLGNTNSTLFTGDIEYHNNVQSTGGSSYWAIPLKEISVSGTRFGIPANMASAAIDTGTTLIAGPTDAVAQIYSSIQGAQKGTGQLDGFWTYPCNSKINLALNFGGKDWPISEADFMFGQANPTTCVGAIFEIPISGNVIQWIVGDTFLKNVYSVYRFTPPSVGFAQLAPSIAGSTPTGSSGGSGGAAETSRALPTLSNDLPPGITGASGLPIPTPASNAAAGAFGLMGWNKVVGCVLGVVAVLMV